MARIICLANSWKHRERCIAGIDTATGCWVRPVTDLNDGRVPRNVRSIGGREPALLDILDIPLAASGPNTDFERENRLILSGRWQCRGRVRPEDVARYLDRGRFVLHNTLPYVAASYLKSLPLERRCTLQLVAASDFSARIKGRREWGGNTWEGTFTAHNGQRVQATITDHVFVTRLDSGYRPGPACLVTVSIGMPYPPGGDKCFKLIAGVIDLANEGASASILEDDIADVPFD